LRHVFKLANSGLTCSAPSSVAVNLTKAAVFELPGGGG